MNTITNVKRNSLLGEITNHSVTINLRREMLGGLEDAIIYEKSQLTPGIS